MMQKSKSQPPTPLRRSNSGSEIEDGVLDAGTLVAEAGVSDKEASVPGVAGDDGVAHESNSCWPQLVQNFAS